MVTDHRRLNSQDDQLLNIRYNGWSIGKHTRTIFICVLENKNPAKLIAQGIFLSMSLGHRVIIYIRRHDREDSFFQVINIPRRWKGKCSLFVNTEKCINFYFLINLYLFLLELINCWRFFKKHPEEVGLGQSISSYCLGCSNADTKRKKQTKQNCIISMLSKQSNFQFYISYWIE